MNNRDAILKRNQRIVDTRGRIRKSIGSSISENVIVNDKVLKWLL